MVYCIFADKRRLVWACSDYQDNDDCGEFLFELLLECFEINRIDIRNSQSFPSYRTDNKVD